MNKLKIGQVVRLETGRWAGHLSRKCDTIHPHYCCKCGCKRLCQPDIYFDVHSDDLFKVNNLCKSMRDVYELKTARGYLIYGFNGHIFPISNIELLSLCDI